MVALDWFWETSSARARSHWKLGSQNGTALACVADVSAKAQVDEMFDTVIEQFGRVDVLVNNAGIVEPDAALEQRADEVARIGGAAPRVPDNVAGRHVARGRSVST